MLKNQISGMLSGKLPMTVQRKVTENVLSETGRFTSAQISQLMKPKKAIIQQGKRKGKRPIIRCKKWSYTDFAKAMPLRVISKKAYDTIRNEHGIPYPGRSTIDRKFR